MCFILYFMYDFNNNNKIIIIIIINNFSSTFLNVFTCFRF